MIVVSPFITRINTAISSVPLYRSCVVLVLLGLLINHLFYAFWSKRNLPPGPRGLPLLGNIFQLPKLQWLRFTEWKDQYGPIFSLNLAGQPVIVLNTIDVATDLLDRRSNIYSDRPRFIVSSEFLGGGMFIAFCGYTKLWRKLRRAGHKGMSIRASEDYQPLQEKEAAALVTALIQDPDAWDDHLKRSAASTVLSAIYAWPPIESKDNPVVARINELVHRFVRAGLPGAHLVEIFPIMKYLPSWMAKWKRESLEWHRKDTEMFEGYLDDVRDTVRAGNNRPSFAASLIENTEHHHLTSKEAAWLAGAMFAGGSETTAASLAVFILAMNLYPEVMKRGQAEIDAVVGRDRIPNFADRPHLPYIRAILKEVLRWRPLSPLGGPRRTVQDDWYNGNFIPKGTIVIPNVWAMSRDPDIFPNYEEFRPERFLDASGQVDVTPPGTRGQGHVAYGFGRRICIGRHFANQELFIGIAFILWAVNIEKATDAHGMDIIPSRTDCIEEGLVVRPALFKCKITARSTDVLARLAEAKHVV